MESTIRLFNGIPIDDNDGEINDTIKEHLANTLAKTLPHGFILSADIVASKSHSEIDEIISTIIKVIGLSGTQMNQSFHKSWKKIEGASDCQLLVEQLIHYITTYGFERLGIYHKDTVYIPREELQIPSLDVEGPLPLTVIKGFTRDEIMEKILSMLSCSIALSEDTIADIINLAIYYDIDETRLSRVTNKEARTMLYDFLEIIPENPVDFLRLVIYLATNTTLVIKNDELIEAIKKSKGIQQVRFFKKYDEIYGFKKLASIFNRFKPLFLAFKTNSKLKHYINKISKLSKKYHVPFEDDYLNQVTALLKHGNKIEIGKLKEKLEKANTFRKVRLAYALQFRTESPSSIMYKIRNGKAYSKEFEGAGPEIIQPVLDIVIDSIVSDLSKKIHGKKIFIPEHLSYALPATEKQFTGNLPSGTSIKVKEDLIVGIHWNNVEEHRIDLDLAMTNIGIKIGWDGHYRSSKMEILFSGDMTTAEAEGASEMFYIKKQSENSFLLSVNYYNYTKEISVPFSIFVAKSKTLDGLAINHVVDPNDVLIRTRSELDMKQKILGLVKISPTGSEFHVSETNIGSSRTLRMKGYMKHALSYLVDFYTHPIRLSALLGRAGAIITSNPREKDDCDIDLSPEAIDKQTILKILAKEGY